MKENMQVQRRELSARHVVLPSPTGENWTTKQDAPSRDTKNVRVDVLRMDDGGAGSSDCRRKGGDTKHDLRRTERHDGHMVQPMSGALDSGLERTVAMQVQHIDDHAATRKRFESSGGVQLCATNAKSIDQESDFHLSKLSNAKAPASPQ